MQFFNKKDPTILVEAFQLVTKIINFESEDKVIVGEPGDWLIKDTNNNYIYQFVLDDTSFFDNFQIVTEGDPSESTPKDINFSKPL